ncbi:MAG: PAS/PAC sensor signal transduction histidine kinase [Parcubacteria group bacterium GW2011_GWA2_44_12]|nr:MAG: PAS/PAC sensor signal transduction histidine kinase [Parcubacteria group bacterium GW2011_GWA2_44_12]
MKHHSADMIKNDFEETLEQSHVGFFKTKLNGKIMYANKAVLQIFGYKTQKALREKNFAHIYRDKAVGQKIIEIIIRQNGTGEKIIAELKRKNNSRLVAQLFASINGKRSSIDWILEDITEQAEIQKELQDIKRETELYRLVFNRAQDWVWIWSFDLHGKILDTSRNIKKITGYTREELIGKDDFELGLIPKKYYPSLHKEWEDRVSGKPGTANRKYEYEVIHRDGKRRFWFQANAISLKRDGKIIGDMTVASDITKQKKAEQKLVAFNKSLEQKVKERTHALIEINKRLKQALEDKVIFFQKASHQLRTPLTVIKGNLEFVSPETKKEQEFELINYEINKLAQIISDFSYLATDDHTKRAHMRKEPVDWKELVAHVSRELAYESKVYGIDVSYTIHARRVYHGEPYYLSKLLHHLLSNAIKFSTDGSHVSLEIADTKQGVSLMCKDQGVGISSIHLKKIFDKFYKIQFDSHKTRHEGSGLGLAICKSVVDLHGGKITIQSALGKGTTIKILLPAF